MRRLAVAGPILSYVQRVELSMQSSSPEAPAARLLLPISEAAHLLSISRATVFRLIRAKQLTPRKIGRRTLLATEELRRYAEGRA